MPLMPGSSSKTVKSNISEFSKGKTFAHTKAKFGAEKARRQAIAVSLKKAGKSNKY